MMNSLLVSKTLTSWEQLFTNDLQVDFYLLIEMKKLMSYKQTKNKIKNPNKK